MIILFELESRSQQSGRYNVPASCMTGSLASGEMHVPMLRQCCVLKHPDMKH